MSKKIKIPQQLFVTVKRVEPYQEEPYRLGFLNAYEPTKATFEKKKKTQMDWAYCGHNINWHWVENGDVVFVKGVDYDWKVIQPDGRPTANYFEREVEDDLQPFIFDNVPRTGFKVLRSVSRYSTSNKVWRVLDPIGLEFEITTGCFEDIIMNATIINGEIQGECVWVSNKKLVVYNDAK